MAKTIPFSLTLSVQVESSQRRRNRFGITTPFLVLTCHLLFSIDYQPPHTLSALDPNSVTNFFVPLPASLGSSKEPNYYYPVLPIHGRIGRLESYNREPMERE